MKKAESDESGNSGDFDIHIRGSFIKDLSENGKKSVVEFAASSYAVLENEQICRIIIERYGKLDQECTFRYFNLIHLMIYSLVKQLFLL